jgi:hypothetical protein
MVQRVPVEARQNARLNGNQGSRKDENQPLAETALFILKESTPPLFGAWSFFMVHIRFTPMYKAQAHGLHIIIIIIIIIIIQQCYLDGHGVGSWVRHSGEHQDVTCSNPSFVTKHHISLYVFPRLLDD